MWYTKNDNIYKPVSQVKPTMKQSNRKSHLKEMKLVKIPPWDERAGACQNVPQNLVRINPRLPNLTYAEREDSWTIFNKQKYRIWLVDLKHFFLMAGKVKCTIAHWLQVSNVKWRMVYWRYITVYLYGVCFRFPLVWQDVIITVNYTALSVKLPKCSIGFGVGCEINTPRTVICKILDS